MGGINVEKCGTSVMDHIPNDCLTPVENPASCNKKLCDEYLATATDCFDTIKVPEKSRKAWFAVLPCYVAPYDRLYEKMMAKLDMHEQLKDDTDIYWTASSVITKVLFLSFAKGKPEIMADVAKALDLTMGSPEKLLQFAQFLKTDAAGIFPSNRKFEANSDKAVALTLIWTKAILAGDEMKGSEWFKKYTEGVASNF